MTECPVDIRSILHDQPWIGWAGVKLDLHDRAMDGNTKLPYWQQAFDRMSSVHLSV